MDNYFIEKHILKLNNKLIKLKALLADEELKESLRSCWFKNDRTCCNKVLERINFCKKLLTFWEQVLQ